MENSERGKRFMQELHDLCKKYDVTIAPEDDLLVVRCRSYATREYTHEGTMGFWV